VAVICVVPIKKESERVKNKNIQKVGDQKLYEICINKVAALQKQGHIDRVYVDTDIEEIQKWIKRFDNVTLIKRNPRRSHYDMSANDTMLYDIVQTNAQPEDVFCHAFITAPFADVLKMRDCIKAIKSGKYNSAFIGERIQSYTFTEDGVKCFEGMPSTQDLPPVYKDTCAFNVTKVKEFKKNNDRYCKDVFIAKCGKVEGIDIDTPEDLEMARAIAKTRK